MGKRKDDFRWMVECKFPEDAPGVVSGVDTTRWGAYMGPMRSKNDCVVQCRFEVIQHPTEKWEGRTAFRAAGYKGRKLVEVINIKTKGLQHHRNS